MSEETSSSSRNTSTKKTEPLASVLTTPIAIVVAGGLIALAVYFSGAAGGKLGSAGDPVPPTQPVAPGGEAPAAVLTMDSFREVDSSDHVRGSADAPVTIIEYSDLECPFCKRFHTTMQQVQAEYGDDVRWVYRHFPLDQLHQQARAESVATECAGAQGKFWELTDKIYEVTTSNDGLDLTTLPQLAQQAGVANISQFETCLESGEFDERIQADVADAQAAGGQGTPYSVAFNQDGEVKAINGAQPFEAIKATIDSLL